MPDISIIVPCYQAQSTLESCVRSILYQDHKDFELLLVDDGSTDRTPELCDLLAASDGRVSVIHQSNQGRSAARENGVKKAHGTWIAFVDADDQLSPSAIRRLSSGISADTDIIFGNGYSLGLSAQQTVLDIEKFRHLAVRGEGTIGVPWGSLYRRSLLSHDVFDLPKDFYMGEDYIFWLRIVFKTSKPVAVVMDKTYDKGPDTTSRRFVWTTDYAERIQDYRLQSIPVSQQADFLADTLADRKVNLFACTLDQPRKTWQQSPFYRNILHDMEASGDRWTRKQQLFLCLPSRHLRRLYSWLSERISAARQ